VLEDHTIDEPAKVVNSIVCVKEDGSVHTIVSGSDFYSNPRISPDGRFLAWVSWDHPSMPFFATELWVAELLLDAEGKTAGIGKAKLIGTKGVDGVDEVSQYPRWIDESTLLYTNDNTGYNNLYKVQVSANGGVQLGQSQLVCQEPLSVDFYSPAWTLNNSDFVVLGNGWLACVVKKKNVASLSLVNIDSGRLRTLKSPFVVISQLRALGPEAVVFSGVQSDEPPAIIVMEISKAIIGNNDTPRWTTIKRSSELVEQGTVPRDYLTKAEAIEFPTELPDGTKTTAHAIILPPCNPGYAAPAGTLPPCIVKIHGGPTSAADAGLNLLYNYWTSRGYMICTVNYGGSTGYGREFMLRLDGQWGVVDVRDAVAAATYLGSDNGKQDGIKKADRAISAQGQRELDRLTENIMPSGAVEFTLDNPGSWDIGLNDAILATTLSAVGALIPGLQVYHGLAAAGLAWLYSKMTHVQQGEQQSITSMMVC
jgi:dipeptidyl aminopeptidase/acylaminoacyl peptidase